jgi:hypothetical protein
LIPSERYALFSSERAREHALVSLGLGLLFSSSPGTREIFSLRKNANPLILQTFEEEREREREREKEKSCAKTQSSATRKRRRPREAR